MVMSVHTSTVMTLYCFSCSNTIEFNHGPHLQTNASVQLCPSNFQLWSWYVRLWRKNRKVLPSLFMIKSTKQISNILDASQVRDRPDIYQIFHHKEASYIVLEDMASHNGLANPSAKYI
ncbi:hypothetical protein EJ05DRAFT_237601 [Pseudovirgaria hyperparasitica]|uniref:Uncharacterized protein n=1 Tax=Pseudovirgaria hyperparasitica TaxID=470096 RepID=A0A6A6VQB5_9PEZI|nr:uncharacterized protein EJ05DRAFT_237601 [Pseudovirgaria hyperparasitica]KAF2752838.1 hypothetical protein EJ05DRAFT_237601 [Pseudovirgaria hyperparasitica]